MPFTVRKADIDRYTSELDRGVALDLRGALGWFGADEDGPTLCISRYGLQQFLYYTLPRKYLAGVEDHIAVARALGDGLEHLGAPAAYADLCRSPETVALLRLWGVDEDAAFARFAALVDASGLEPPDVDELQWQGVMGLAEAQTRDAAMLALERALESGDGRPAAKIVRAVLAEPDPEGRYPTRLLAVQAERIDRWAGWRSSPRRTLLEPLVDDLVDAELPEWPADNVLDWLLDEARAGLALTERGALGRALCIEVATRRPGWTWGKPPRSESDIANLESLHRALRDSGLVRRRGRKLFATKRARDLTPGARRVRVLERLLDNDTFVAAVAELTMAALAQAAPDAGAQIAAAIEAAGWRSGGGPLPDHAVPSTMTDVRRVLLAIGAAEGDALSRRDCTLTGPGRAAVLCALRAHALRSPPPSSLLPDPQPRPGLNAERAAVALPPVPGGIPPGLDPTDEDDRAKLIRLAHPEMAAAIEAGEETVLIGGEAINPRLHLLMHQVVADRLLHGDPPDDWLAFRALVEGGGDAHEAQHVIGRRFVAEMMAEVGPPSGDPPHTSHPRVRGDRGARNRRKAQRAARRRNRR
ncbi:MAG TPA: hypothetical protein VMU39_08015 [Solirubrobacteraceae bacterium]|nr:hypothetical protein [Solirubrobacteraceae bacterium]